MSGGNTGRLGENSIAWILDGVFKTTHVGEVLPEDRVQGELLRKSTSSVRCNDAIPRAIFPSREVDLLSLDTYVKA
jgi:hypothetical protein